VITETLIVKPVFTGILLLEATLLFNIKMIDAVKDYLAPRRFGIITYTHVHAVVHFVCRLAFTVAVTTALITRKFTHAVLLQF
jgi:hypothetical protein